MTSWGTDGPPGVLPTSIEFRAGRRQLEQVGDRQPVVDDDVGGGEHLGAANGQQTRVTGSGTNEVDGHGARAYADGSAS